MTYEEYIRMAAAKRGMDPNKVVRVARTEGLAPGIWQSNVRNKAGIREPSYGPFQLLLGGKGTGFPEGMGNAFQRATGLDPSDPANAFPGIDYALDTAAKEGWGQWYGPKNAGLDRWYGINGAKPIGVTLNSAQPVADIAQASPRLNPGDPAPAFGPAKEIGDIGVAENQPKNILDSLTDNSFMKGMKELGKKPGISTGVGLLAQGLGGGGGDQDRGQLIPSSQNLSNDPAMANAAAQLMNSILMKKRGMGGVPGLSMMG